MHEMTFAELIKERRIERKWSLNKVGDKAKLTSTYIHRLETGERENPSFSVVCQLVEALELDFLEVCHTFGFKHLIEPYMETQKKTQSITIQYYHIRNKELFHTSIELIIQYITKEETDGILPELISVMELLRKEHQTKPSLVSSE